VSSGAIEINQKSTCSKTDAVGYIDKNPKTFKKVKFDKDREKIKELLKLVSTQTISRSTPTSTKEGYSISNGTW